MKTLFDIITFVFVLASLGVFLIGIFKPTILIKKKFFGRRILLFLISIVLLISCNAIINYKIENIFTPKERESYYTENRLKEIQDSIETVKEQNKKTIEEKGGTVITAKVIVNDSSIIQQYKPKFDSLYTKLMNLDSDAYGSYDRVGYHEKIQDLLFNKWWVEMEKLDSIGQKTPLAHKEYTKCAKKYDKQYARFVVYGNEDKNDIEFCAKNKAKTVLNESLNDPESLDISKVVVNGKVKQGWKCSIIYRAKNAYGGYVREVIFMILSYNIENRTYDVKKVWQ